MDEDERLDYEYEQWEYCYECTGYGDYSYYDPDLDKWVSNCDTCPYNQREED